MDELRDNLGTYPYWGFVIYRTTYSADSDTLFPDAIRFIEACFKQEFFQETKEYPPNEPNEIWAKQRSTILQNPAQFNGASLEAIRAYLRPGWTLKACVTVGPNGECA